MSGQRFSLANVCMPSGIACNRAARATCTHVRKLGSRRACPFHEERELRRVRDAYLSLSPAITSGWSKSTRHGISEIIISQSLAGWQICQQGVKCQLLRDRGIWIDFFRGYRGGMCTGVLQEYNFMSFPKQPRLHFTEWPDVLVPVICFKWCFVDIYICWVH